MRVSQVAVENRAFCDSLVIKNQELGKSTEDQNLKHKFGKVTRSAS